MSGYVEIIQNEGDVFPESKKNDLVMWATDSNQSIRIGVGDNQGIILDYKELTLNNNLTVWSVSSIFKGDDADTSLHPSFTWQNNDDMGLYREDSNVMGMSVNGAGKLFLTSNGVGINTSTPSADLHVNGSIRAKTFENLSDARFKEGVSPITSLDALDQIERLNAYKFAFKDDVTKTRKIGLMAQEVLDVVPECVNTQDPDMYTVAYADLVPLLIESVKELNSKIKDLEKKCSS